MDMCLNKDGTPGLLLAFGVGVLAGSAALLLLTPYSGREVREKIGVKSDWMKQ